MQQNKNEQTNKKQGGYIWPEVLLQGQFFCWNLNFPQLQSIYIPLNHKEELAWLCSWINPANKLQMQKFSIVLYSGFH